MSNDLHDPTSKDLYADFWKWIYTCKHIQYLSPEIVPLCNFAIDKLNRYIDDDYKTIKDMILATDCGMLKEERQGLCIIQHNTKHIDLSEDEQNALKYMVYFSRIFGYFFPDMFFSCEPDFIINHYIENKRLPYSPIAYPSSLEQICRIFTNFGASPPKIDQSNFEYIPISINISFTCDCSQSDKTIEKNKKIGRYLQQQMDSICRAISHMNNKNNLFENQTNRKYIVEDSFSHTSIFGRIIGLFIYDFIKQKKLPLNVDIIYHIEKSQYFQKIVEMTSLLPNKDFLDIEQTTIKRWLSRTSKCIEDMAVLSLK